MTQYFGWIAAARASLAFKPIVVINMDETSIRFGYGKRRGTVGLPSAWSAINQAAVSENMSTSQTHGAITYCAFICDNAEVQTRLPQVLISRTKMFSRAMENLAGVLLPGNMEIWLQETSGWVTALVFMRLIRRLHSAIADLQDRFAFFLVTDALRAHISMEIATLIYELGLTLVFVPARLTWLLQPLDTHYFAILKQRLVAHFATARLENDEGALPKLQWLRIVIATIAEFSGMDFSHGIARCGLAGPQREAAPVTKGLVTIADADFVHLQPPTREQLPAYLGRKNVPFYDILMQPLETEESEDDNDSELPDSRYNRPLLRIVVPRPLVRIVVAPSSAAAAG